ncbi:MAG: nucleotidyltransferase domain-containing protein [Prosthecobacter sp.]|uniref:nucleotidyltransferase domain-containing protein n=1 Tax=Prosthecobacter sp. TaxID=1965333 RepID=UPI003902FF85
MIDLSRIRRYTDAIAERFKPQRIVLFGSHAYGRPTEDSDVDLLVVMPFDRSQGRKSAEIRQALSAGFPLDLIVRTPEDVQWRLEQGDCFLQEVLTKGKVMYEAALA